ncbi:MAG: aldo/keto reductase family protein [Candidatus Hodarchaeales archaeon]
MKYRNMGKHGIRLSEVSLGGWLTYGNSVEQDITGKCIHEAFNQGINFIDVADIYAKGKSEEAVGKVLKQENEPRKNLVISSKVFWPMSENVNDVGLSRKHIHDSIDGTLERLGTDYLDIYFCHRWDPYTPIEETVQAMDDLIRNGKIQHWGTSVWSAAQLERAAGVAKEIGAHPPSVEQPRYNMIDRHIELEIMDTTTYHGMGIVPWSPLAQGFLTGKYKKGVIPDDSRAKQKDFMKFLERYFTDDYFSTIEKLEGIAKELDMKLSQLALAWALRRKEISSVITGASRPEQVQENALATEINLSNDISDRIEEVLGNKPEPHPIYATSRKL